MNNPLWKVALVALTVSLVACAEEEQEEQEKVVPTDVSGMPDTGDTMDLSDPEVQRGLYLFNCGGCHGDSGQGGTGGPSLTSRSGRLTVASVTDTILNGSGYMNPVNVSEAEAETISDYLVNVLLAD